MKPVAYQKRVRADTKPDTKELNALFSYSPVRRQHSDQLSYVPISFLRLTLSLRICCPSLLSIFSPASMLSTESNRIPRLMNSMDSMKSCRQCRCRRPATQDICPCPVIQIVPNNSGLASDRATRKTRVIAQVQIFRINEIRHSAMCRSAARRSGSFTDSSLRAARATSAYRTAARLAVQPTAAPTTTSGRGLRAIGIRRGPPAPSRRSRGERTLAWAAMAIASALHPWERAGILGRSCHMHLDNRILRTESSGDSGSSLLRCARSNCGAMSRQNSPNLSTMSNSIVEASNSAGNKS